VEVKFGITADNWPNMLLAGRRHHGRGDAGARRIAEEAGAVAVMALERVPADIRVRAAWRACPTQV
jgi:hypothetical protein